MRGELCDGWLALFYSPYHDDFYREALNEGLRAGRAATRTEFEIAATVPLIVTDDIEAAADAVRPMYALYFGGMGAAERQLPRQRPDPDGIRGRGRQDPGAVPAGQKHEAAAAVPTKLVEQLTLIGPKEKIRDDLEAWRESTVTTILIGGDAQTLRTAAELVLAVGGPARRSSPATNVSSSAESWSCALISAPPARATGPIQQRIVGPRPSMPRAGSRRSAATSRVGRIVDHVAALAGVEEQVVQRLARDRPLGPAAGDVRVLARAVVAVRQDRVRVVVEPADVLVALGADRALRLVRGVVGQLGEDLGAGAGRLLAARRAAAASGPPATAAGRCRPRSQIVGKMSMCETSSSCA